MIEAGLFHILYDKRRHFKDFTTLPFGCKVIL